MARATRIALDMALAAGKTVKPVVGTIWQYAKTEIAPPLTYSFFHGPGGKALEQSATKFADGVLSALESRIKEIDAEAIKAVKEKEAAIKAAQDHAAAAAQAAARLKEEIAKRQQEIKQTADKAKIESKAKEQKKEEPKKIASAAKPKAAKQKEPARKKPPKTNRRQIKKGSAPKKSKK